MTELGVAIGLMALAAAIVLADGLRGQPRPPRKRRASRPAEATPHDIVARRSRLLVAVRLVFGIAALAVAAAIGIFLIVRGIGLIVERLFRF